MTHTDTTAQLDQPTTPTAPSADSVVFAADVRSQAPGRRTTQVDATAETRPDFAELIRAAAPGRQSTV